MGAHRLGQRAALPVILNPWLGKTTEDRLYRGGGECERRFGKRMNLAV
jgi:hypothetical protein